MCCSRQKDEKKVERAYGLLPFVLEEVEGEGTVTPRAGLAAVAEAARAMGLPEVVEREVRLKRRERGYSEWEFIESFVLLLCGGGECVDDLGVLRSDSALSKLVGHEFPSASAGKKFLYAFEDPLLAGEDAKQRELFPSYVWRESAALVGLGRVCKEVVRQAHKSRPERVATLDQDATIVESSKRAAAMTYQGKRGYQPMIVLWAEQDVVVADEFRDGNVPPGSGVLRVARAGFEALPAGVERVYYRGDSASYSHKLLNWLREEQDGRPRAIFAVSADMSPELRAVALATEEWHSDPEDPCRSWAELDFVPSGPSVKKGRKPDRYLGIRIRPPQGELFSDGSEEKYFAVVTNDFERGGLEIINWHRQRAGTVEHTHDVLKNELGAGVLPSERFAANAAWFRLNVLTYNILSVLRRNVLPRQLERARPKRLRFVVFSIAARVISHARRIVARVVGHFQELGVRLTQIRQRLMKLRRLWGRKEPSRTGT